MKKAGPEKAAGKTQQIGIREELKPHLQTIQFMNESTEDYLYLYDLLTDRIYFTDKVRERYPLPPAAENGYVLGDWRDIVYIRDHSILEQHLEQIRKGKKKTYHLEYRLIDKAGNKVWVNSRGTTQVDQNGQPTILFGRVSELDLGYMVDRLTGLRNTDKFTLDMETCLKESDGYLMILGIDNFKNINIKNGRTFGNHILKAVTEVLEDHSEYPLNLYRLGGDCFAVNFPQKQQDYVLNFYHTIQKELEHQCTVSAGVVAYQSSEAADSGAIYQYAESALDCAKKEGRNTLVFFSSDDYQKDLDLIKLQDEISASIQEDCKGFYLCYQPQIKGQDFRLYGVEALLRYNSPSRGMVGPGEFIPLLEQSGLICPVGTWVLKTALHQCKQWRKWIPNLHINVNISYVQLQQDDISDTVLNLLEEIGLPGEALTLEVTESMKLQDQHYFNKLFYKWKRHGIKIAIDDFGTGYSGLSYLKSIDIDEAKIDRYFVNHIQYNAYNYRLLSNIIELAHGAQIKVCCEGVESEDELVALQELHPDLLQGFLFAKPYTIQEFEQNYIHTDAKAYQDREAKEDHFRHLSSCKNKELLEGLRKEEIGNIVEGLEEILYVSDVDTYDLYYLNPAGRQQTGIYDYKGCKCYQVLQGRNEPCEFCTNACLEQDTFHVWESENKYLNRHFILKDKLIPWQGKMARLEMAIDITEKEIVSKSIQKKLNFEKAIVESCKILASESNNEKSTNNVLKIIGEFYQADRAYILKPDQTSNLWNVTWEWRAEGADSLNKIFPAQLEQLHHRNLDQMIAAPITRRKKMIGVVGVDNPRYRKEENDLVNTMAYFLGYSMVGEETEERLNDFLTCHYEDILNNTDLGLWVIRMNPEKGQYQMYIDQVMRRILEIDEDLTPEECYKYWYSRINEGYYHYINFAIDNIIQTGKSVQIEYTWNLPSKGEVTVRCLGVRVEDSKDMICLEGYHQIISEMERPDCIPSETLRETFEYNDRRKSIYFHTKRELLAGDELREYHFPDCWIEQEIVHPHFAEKFRNIFENVQQQEEDSYHQEMLLRSKNGAYEWFKLGIKHLGMDAQDIHTIMVAVEPAERQRAIELEYMRKSDFYEAILSEAVAFAEVDVESGQLTRSGGLWACYWEELQKTSGRFEQIVQCHIKDVVPPEYELDYRKYLNLDHMKAMYHFGVRTQKYQFRRYIDQQLCWVELVIHTFQNHYSENMYALLYLKNVDSEKRRELAQEMAAKRDPLTNVYNRTTFEFEVTRFMAKNQTPPSGTLLILDLDNFKTINDQFGHLQGDESLKMLAKILKRTFRHPNIIGRLGGDEFLVFVKGITDRQILDKQMEDLFQKLAQLPETPLSCSVGINCINEATFSYNEELAKADLALYQSKKRGKNQYSYFEG